MKSVNEEGGGGRGVFTITHSEREMKELQWKSGLILLYLFRQDWHGNGDSAGSEMCLSDFSIWSYGSGLWGEDMF